IIDDVLEKTQFKKKLEDNHNIDSITEDDLQEIGDALRISELNNDERQLLIAILLPSNPQVTFKHNELPRLKSYCLLLRISEILRKVLTEDEIFIFVANINSSVPDELEETRFGWLLYFSSDMLAVVFEANLELIRSVLDTRFEPLKPINLEFILKDILDKKNLINQTLNDFSLISNTETYENLGFNDLYNKFEKSLGNVITKKGISIWNTNLNELEIILAAKSKDFNVVVLLPISLLIIHFRLKNSLNHKNKFVENILKTGFNEISYENIILKKIEGWLSNNTLLIEVIAFLLEYVIEQHNHIIWSRLAFDTKRNTTIVIKDNESWSTTKNNFRGGRTQSRLKQAIGWLKELSLIGNNGITELGKDTLQNRLDMIKQYINNES